MKDPFNNPAVLMAFEAVMGSMAELRDKLDAAREQITPLLDAELNKGGTDADDGCTCVYNELFELDALLFSVYHLTHLHGSGVITRIHNVRSHDQSKLTTDQIKAEYPDLAKKLSDALSTVGDTVVELGNDIEDTEPQGGLN